MSEHTANWDATRQLLREARGCLPAEPAGPAAVPVPTGLLTGTLEEFEEFLEQNELELAWDALAAVARRQNASALCWQKMARAAALMQLPEKRDEALKRATPAVPADQALAIARADAEKAYRDLLEYRITLALEPDGWHVDFDLKNPTARGGGPRYVIDPASGVITWKVYEQ